MTSRWALLFLLSSVVALGQQTQTASSTPPASPPTPAAPRTFATVTNVLQTALDSRSCNSGKEFRTNITSAFVFSGQAVEKGAELSGRVQACNRDQNDKLAVTVVVIDSLLLPGGKVVPIAAVLQAIGPPPPPLPVSASNTDIGYVATQDYQRDVQAYGATIRNAETVNIAARGVSNVGVLDRSSTGVIGLKHVTFENAAMGPVVGWMFTAEKTPLDLRAGSQLVVRLMLAATAPSHP